MPRSAIIILALSQLMFCQANADTLFGEGWYVSGTVSYIDDDQDRDADDGLSGYHLGIGKDLNTASSVEFNAIAAYFNADGFDADQQQWGLGVDLVGRIGGMEYFAPYVVLGAGYIKSQNKDPGRPDGDGTMKSIGVGILTPLNIFGMKLRTELRLRVDDSVGVRRDYLLSIGLQRAIRPRPSMFRDTDGDGVADPDDRCGNTGPGMIVDRYGCARSRDKDRDGVPD